MTRPIAEDRKRRDDLLGIKVEGCLDPSNGGRERNKHGKKKLRAGRGGVGKSVVIGAKDRGTNKVKAKVVEKTDAETLQEFVIGAAAPGATVFTDDAAAYKGMPYDHESVRHSVGEYVRDQARTPMGSRAFGPP